MVILWQIGTNSDKIAPLWNVLHSCLLINLKLLQSCVFLFIHIFMVLLVRTKCWKMLDSWTKRLKFEEKFKLPIVRIRMFDIDKDILSTLFCPYQLLHTISIILFMYSILYIISILITTCMSYYPLTISSMYIILFILS